MDNKHPSVANANPLPSGYTVRDGHLFLDDLDVANFAHYWLDHSGQTDAPLTIRSMTRVRTRIQTAREALAAASAETGYKGEIRLAYASKANANEAMVRTAISSGVDYECSSRVDVSIVRRAIDQGWLTANQIIIANGFKVPAYADQLIQLAMDEQAHVIPILDSREELALFASSGVDLEVGLRYREPGRADHFGMTEPELMAAAADIAAAPNLKLRVFHAIQHYPAIDSPEHLESLKRAFEVFLRLRTQYPTLHFFDLGGGLPVELAESDDLQEWMVSVQKLILECSDGGEIPGLIIESGRHLAGCHELEVFRIARVKIVDGLPYYIIGGGIMSNLPDSWALGIEFPVTAVNHLDKPHQLVRLAGLTCDHDDVYPSKPNRYVSLPVPSDDLLVAFLDVGAYQDMLGGEGGAKHCLLSEGATVIIGDDPAHPTRVTYQPPEATDEVLKHIGYGLERFSTF